MNITVTFPGHSRVDAAFDGHVVHTDQPLDHGGDGTAPAPFDLFLASIGTCVGYYVMRFMQQRKLATDGASVRMETERSDDGKLVERVRLKIHVPADFPPKYHKALVNAAALCTVKRHLEHPPTFETSVESTTDSSAV